MNEADATTRAGHAAATRPVAASDLAVLKAVVKATGLFPAELMDNMLAPYLRGEAGDEARACKRDAPAGTLG